jgi:hypothetical protein
MAFSLRARIHPCHKSRRINRALAPEVTISRLHRQTSRYHQSPPHQRIPVQLEDQ